MPDRHHYVPQLLLRNFAADGQIWLFDKRNDKSFKTNIKNAFVEGDYNTVVGEHFNLEAEEIFCRAEDVAAPTLKKILETESVKPLSEDERATLATFVTIQYLRSKQSRRTFELMREHMQSRFPGIPQSDYPTEVFSPTELDKYASLDFLVQNLAEFTNLVAQKDLILVERNCPGSFWMSDHPVILHNDNHRGYGSNIGLGIQGIQIYLPISPQLAIAFFCPSLANELERGIETITRARGSRFSHNFANGTLSGKVNLELANMNKQKQKLKLHLKAIRDDQKIYFNDQNLLFLNSHQVLSAFRFLAAATDEFALARDMIGKNPKLRKPDLIQFG